VVPSLVVQVEPVAHLVLRVAQGERAVPNQVELVGPVVLLEAQVALVAPILVEWVELVVPNPVE